MTTIAYNNGVMAGDTLAMDNSGLKSYYPKITTVDIDGDQWLFGSAGDTSVAMRLLKQVASCAHLNDVLALELCDPDDKNAAILCRGKNIFRKVGVTWRKHPDDHYFAIGSGRDFALMAMHLGKSAKEAVELAGKFDGYTGGETMVLYSEGA